MSSHNEEPPVTGNTDEFAKALVDLAKGEQTADKLERHLDGLEKRIEELLAAANASGSGTQNEAADSNTNASTDATSTANGA